MDLIINLNLEDLKFTWEDGVVNNYSSYQHILLILLLWVMLPSQIIL